MRYIWSRGIHTGGVASLGDRKWIKPGEIYEAGVHTGGVGSLGD